MRFNIVDLYRTTPRLGRVLAVGIFLTHGLFDFLTTSYGMHRAELHPNIEPHQIETNPFIATMNTFEIFLTMAVASILLFILTLYIFNFCSELDNERGEESNLYYHIAIVFCSIIFLSGIFIVFNNSIVIYLIFFS